MYRRIICMLIIVCVVFNGCGIIKPKMNFEKVSKKFLGLSAYTCDVTMRVTNNRSTMEYKLKHFYKNPDKYRVEIIAPKELQGQVTIFNGRSSYIYHPGIDQYLVTENFSGSVEYSAFIGSFMNHLRKADDIKISSEKAGEKELMVLEFEIPESNSYMYSEKLWLDIESIVPVKAEIYGSDGKTSVEVYYDNFICNPGLKDGDFEIVQKNSKKAQEMKKMYDLRKIRAAWAEVDLDALAHNMREARRLADKDAIVTAIIKADGYGHGARKIAQTLLDNGAGRFAVAVLDEGIELRREGFKVPILVLGFTDKERSEEVISYNLRQTVYSWDLAEALSREAVKQGKTAKIHIKIDTGMGRIGLQPDKESVQLIKKISLLPNLAIEGIFTHFAVADTVDKTYTKEQYEKFKWICGELEKENIKTGIRNCGNSAAIIDLPDMHMNAVRAGIMLYGLKPSDEVMLGKLELKQVMSLKVRISHVKEIEAGQSVSYGRKFIAEKKSTIATLPIGYADGYTRMLTGKAEALIHGRRVPVVGRICMDQCMIDVTGIEDVKVGDEVVLFGKQGNEFIHIDELAEKLETINYEIVCMISKRVPRIYLKDGKIVDTLNYIIG